MLRSYWLSFLAQVLVFQITLTKGADLLKECTTDTECPLHASCQSRWCYGKICLCGDSYTPSHDEKSCVQGRNLGETCDTESKCSIPESDCLNGTCKCHDGHSVANASNIDLLVCVPNPLDNAEIAVLGQTCNENIRCVGEYVECQERVCQCLAGYRGATVEEMRLFPFVLHQCIPDSFKPDRTVNITGDCQKFGIPTRSTSPTSSSTTTTTTSTTTITTSTSSSSASTTRKPTTTSPRTTSTSTTSTTSLTTSTHTTPSSSTSIPTTTSSSPSTKPTTTSTTTSVSPSTTTKSTTTPRPTSSTTKSTTTTAPTTQTSSITQSTTTTLSTTSTPAITTTHSTITSSMKPTTTSSITTTLPPSSTTKSTITGTVRQPGNSNATNATTESSTIKSSTTVKVESTSTTSTSTPKAVTTTVHIGGKCGTCPDNSECEQDSCNVYRCRCKLGYANSPDKTHCWKLSALGEDCSESKICQGPFTACDSGTCKCEDEYEPSDNGRWCRLKDSWFIDFPLLGEKCSGGLTSDCYMEYEQTCVDDVCKCKEGLRGVVEGNDADRKAMYPGISQCRNASLPAGYRPRDLCEGQSRESATTDIYDKAKSKIRTMQGAIIGGSIGGVALIGIIVGTIALVRWKRRERRGTMRDASSTASTEGQRSRYSFKIPRPFASYESQKEYNSNQISYPNTALDREETPTTPHNTPRSNHEDLLDRRDMVT